jgi:hypothetical protein
VDRRFCDGDEQRSVGQAGEKDRAESSQESEKSRSKDGSGDTRNKDQESGKAKSSGHGQEEHNIREESCLVFVREEKEVNSAQEESRDSLDKEENSHEDNKGRGIRRLSKQQVAAQSRRQNECSGRATTVAQLPPLKWG